VGVNLAGSSSSSDGGGRVGGGGRAGGVGGMGGVGGAGDGGGAESGGSEDSDGGGGPDFDDDMLNEAFEQVMQDEQDADEVGHADDFQPVTDEEKSLGSMSDEQLLLCKKHTDMLKNGTHPNGAIHKWDNLWQLAPLPVCQVEWGGNGAISSMEPKLMNMFFMSPKAYVR